MHCRPTSYRIGAGHSIRIGRRNLSTRWTIVAVFFHRETAESNRLLPATLGWCENKPLTKIRVVCATFRGRRKEINDGRCCAAGRIIIKGRSVTKYGFIQTWWLLAKRKWERQLAPLPAFLFFASVGCGHELMTDFNGMDPSVLERERRKREKNPLGEKGLYPKTRF